jgi:LCP family protein required for cell wall assembly
LGDQYSESRSWNNDKPSKLRLALSFTAITLALATVAVSVTYVAFPCKAGQKDSVQCRMENATQAAQQALSAVPFIPKLDERMNVLIMGVDWNGEDAERYQGNRSDTMMLVTLDPDHDKVGIISIPRDSRVAVGRGHNKINQAHAIGGPEYAVETVKENFNVPVDHYVVVDTVGLKDLFKLLGPVEVVVEKEMHYEDHTSGLKIDLKPGKQLLTAEQAEGYVRFRKDAYADLGRMERQQWFLRQSLSKLKDPAVLLKAPQLLEAGYKCVKTDLPPDKIAAIMSFVKDLQPGSVLTSTLPGDGATIDGVAYFILDEKGTQNILERFALVPPAPREERSEEVVRDEETLRKKTRITIRYRESAQGQADFMADQLKEHGWRVRQILTHLDNDCQHAQINLNNRKATAEVISLVRNDLPEISDFPVVVKYGQMSGCELSVVLPGPAHTAGMHGTTATAAAPPNSDTLAVQTQ